ncbi:MAG: GAF domain-containing protein [Chloroflexi bacterium]|nr:GAF domain-containing protein [Chloroflexota bacterium]
MSFYLLLPLLAFAFNGLLVYPVLRSNPHSPINRVFSLFLVSMSLWGLTLFFMRNSPTLEQALVWERTVLPTFVGATLFFFHFTFLYAHIRPSRWVLPAAYAAAIAIAAMVPLNLLVTAMERKFYGYAPVVTPYFYLYLAFLYTMVTKAFFNLYRSYSRASTDEERNRTAYMLVGMVCSVVGGTTDFLPVLGLRVYPLGIVGNILFAFLVTLAIVRQRLFDIRIVVRRGVTLTLLSGVLAALYVGLFLLLNNMFHLLGLTFPIWLQIVVLVSIGMALQPFYGRVQQIVDRVFYQDRYDYLRAFERFAQETKELTDLKLISETLVRLSTLAMDAQWALLLQHANISGRNVLVLGASNGPVGHPSEVAISMGSPLVRWLQQREGAHLGRDVQVLPQWLALPQAELDLWRSLDARVYVPLQGKQGLTAILLLGDKNIQEPYSREDLRVLQSVANQAAIAMENAGLYQEISTQLERGRTRLEALRQAAGRLALEEDPDRALQNLVDVARELLEARRLGLAVLQPQDQDVRLFTSGLSLEEYQRFQQFVVSHGAHARTAQKDFPPSIGFSSQELWASVLSPDDLEGLSTLRASFATKSQGMGVLELAGKRGALTFTPDDSRLLDLFTVLAGVLLDNANLYDDVAQERLTLSAIQESMAEGLIVLDPERRVLYCNKAAETLTGIITRQSIGASITAVWRFNATDFESAREMEDLLATIGNPPEIPKRLEVALVNPQRQELAITVFPIPGEIGQPMTGILVRDITQERDLQRRRDEFVAIASHELRTPMTTILGFSELLLSREPPLETRREWLQFIHRDIQRLAFIVEDLLNISRIQSGRMKVDLAPVLLSKVMEPLAVVWAGARKHSIHVDVPPDMPIVMADQAKLAQVIANLVDNAIKYSPQGGSIHISACFNLEEGTVTVSVEDQGIGIAEEDQEDLFTIFHRINRPETQGIRGTGLGLYIVKELVELMHGKIWVQSTLGKGSTFSFSLPLQPLPPKEPEVPDAVP